MEKIVILAITNNGIQLGRRINESLGTALPIYVPQKHKQAGEQIFPKADFKANMHFFFQQYDALICIMAAGIVVRSLAEVIQDKCCDPAVIVLDEKGENVISLLSGHVGGGNVLTRKIAEAIQAHPVITTATDVQDVTAIDLLAKEIHGWYRDFKLTTKKINGLLAAHRKVGLIQGKYQLSDTRGLTLLTPTDDFTGYEAILWISSKNNVVESDKMIQIVPRKYILGIGSKKAVPFEQIQAEYLNFCEQQQLHSMAVSKVVSIDLKANEAGIIKFAQWLAVPFETYSKEQLATAADKYPQSTFVKEVTGVGNVALAAADVASGDKVISQRYANQGVTFALGEE